MKNPWHAKKTKDIDACLISPDTYQEYNSTQQQKGRHERRKTAKRMLERVSDFERGVMWKIWANTEHYKDRSPKDLYKDLLAFDLCDHDVAIKKDVKRTFPEHSLFNDSEYTQNVLFNVLRAYAIYNPDVGYCQGMAFIAGMLVVYMDEEDAFYTMISVMDKHGIKRLFLPQMKQLERYCDVLEQYIRRKMKRLYRHMQKHDVDISIVASQWFLTLFTYNFSLDTAALLWDALLAMDNDWMLSIAIAIFKLMERTILQSNQEEIHNMMKDLTPYLSARTIIRKIHEQDYERKAEKLLKHYDQK
ncbi:TBC domain containing protein, putative [Babesia ovis]|uniref:TBC domain containing protein, putative n=1 Tax=Babesia ovis TaxID=5869 RepID=A0A9W5TEL7_BABOV|nr:TBC domain containing protein, putative [Babesia ovis]